MQSRHHHDDYEEYITIVLIILKLPSPNLGSKHCYDDHAYFLGALCSLVPPRVHNINLVPLAHNILGHYKKYKIKTIVG